MRENPIKNLEVYRNVRILIYALLLRNVESSMKRHIFCTLLHVFLWFVPFTLSYLTFTFLPLLLLSC